MLEVVLSNKFKKDLKLAKNAAVILNCFKKLLTR